MNNDWSDEETDNPLRADDRNFYKVEKWTKDGLHITELLYAGNDLEKAREIFTWLQSLGRGGLIRSANAFAWWPIGREPKTARTFGLCLFRTLFNSIPRTSVTDRSLPCA